MIKIFTLIQKSHHNNAADINIIKHLLLLPLILTRKLFVSDVMSDIFTTQFVAVLWQGKIVTNHLTFLERESDFTVTLLGFDHLSSVRTCISNLNLKI